MPALLYAPSIVQRAIEAAAKLPFVAGATSIYYGLSKLERNDFVWKM